MKAFGANAKSHGTRVDGGVQPAKSGGAFTLVELLVVMAVISILGALLLPALSRAKNKAQQSVCGVSLGQLQLAWLNYAHDHEDRLPPNGLDVAQPARVDLQLWWAQGNLDYDPANPENGDPSLLIDRKYAVLGEYIQSATVFRCPSDRTVGTRNGKTVPRVRSYSMNSQVGAMVECLAPTPIPKGPQRLADLRNPSGRFIFIEENPDSIGFVSFWVDEGRGVEAKIASYPAAYHGAGANLSFADGHVEYRRWRDERTRPLVKYEKWLAETLSPNNPDVAWLQERTDFSSSLNP